MDRVELIINAGKISSRIKFFLQDVVELRNVLYASVSLFVCVCLYSICVRIFVCVCVFVCVHVYALWIAECCIIKSFKRESFYL